MKVLKEHYGIAFTNRYVAFSEAFDQPFVPGGFYAQQYRMVVRV